MLVRAGYLGDVQNTRFKSIYFTKIDDVKKLLGDYPLAVDEYRLDGDPDPIAIIHPHEYAYKGVSPKIPTAQIDGRYKFMGPAVILRISPESANVLKGLTVAEISAIRQHVVLVQSLYKAKNRLKTWEIIGDLHTFPEARHIDQL